MNRVSSSEREWWFCSGSFMILTVVFQSSPSRSRPGFVTVLCSVGSLHGNNLKNQFLLSQRYQYQILVKKTLSHLHQIKSIFLAKLVIINLCEVFSCRLKLVLSA
jgi:hypothetical protein